MGSTSNAAIAKRLKRQTFYFRLVLVSCLTFLIRLLGLEAETIKKALLKQVTVIGPSPKSTYTLLLDSFSVRTEPRYIVLVTCSDGFFEMWLNWLAYFEKMQLQNLPVHLFAEDHLTYLKCLNQLDSMSAHDLYMGLDLACLSWDTVFPQEEVKQRIGAKGYRTTEYKKMMSHRPAIVQYELELGNNVIFSDLDTVWLQDPRPYFQDDVSTAHILAQRDGEKAGKAYLCPGFMVYRSCPETIAFVGIWKSELEGKEMRNQRAFNFLLTKKAKRFKLNIITKTLPRELFPDGTLYFEAMSDVERSKVVVIHNNGISGYENKVDRMKEFGLWIF